MIKLYEVYIRKIISRDFFQKIYDFLNEIKDDDVQWNNENRIFIIAPDKRLKLLIKISPGTKDEIKIFHYLLENDPLLLDYLYKVFENYFEVSLYKYSAKTLTVKVTELINDINFSKLDYEIFKETERFGL